MRMLLFALVLLFPLQANAAGMHTVEEGVRRCEKAITALDGGAYNSDAASCIAYMGGVYDVFTSHVLRWPACAPPHLLHQDFIKAFLAWSYRNPDVWHEPLFRGVMAMITEVYPCR